MVQVNQRMFMNVKRAQTKKGFYQFEIRKFSALPDHIMLDMPNLSPTMEKGNIGTWAKQVGDKIEPGDILCSIETDKATVDFEMQDEGYVAKLLYPEGTKDIPLGKPLAIIVEDEDDIAAFADYVPQEGAATSAPPKEAPAATPEPVATPTPAATPAATPVAVPAKPAGSRIFASPLAQNQANAQGIDLSQLQGTGPGGRIIKADIDDALAAGGTSKAAATQIFDSVPAAGFVDLENSQIRKVIAERLTYSKQNIPHYYVTVQVSVDNLMKVRAKLNNISEVKLSVNDFVMKAASMAAMKVPATNSSWMDDFIR